MRCPECVRLDLRSIVRFYGPHFRTLMGGGGQYWDEDGNCHYHDPNHATKRYLCSEGHIFQPHQKPCESCDYREAPEKLLEVRCEASGMDMPLDVATGSIDCTVCDQEVMLNRGSTSRMVNGRGTSQIKYCRVKEHFVKVGQ